MPKLLTNEELRDLLSMEYSQSTTLPESRTLRKENIDAFNAISRNGLKFGEKERRIIFYRTLKGEEVFIQYPGKESQGDMPLDFRPGICANGSVMPNAAFGEIWDTMDAIGKKHNDYLSFVASLFLRIGYMHGYKKVRESYPMIDIDVTSGTQSSAGSIDFCWNMIDFPDDFWYSLNDKVGDVELFDGYLISFEAFIKYVDLLFQNEDCKYYYRNSVLAPRKDADMLKNGRNSSSDANLAILNYLQGNKKLSKLLNEFQKGRGVTSFRKADYSVVTNGIITNIDMH